MAQKGRRKGVSFYFRIELNTLQGKITSGFCFLGVLAAVMMAIASWLIYPALERSQYIVEVINATDHQLMLLSANTERTIARATNQVLLSKGFSEEDLASSTKAIQTPLDSLRTLSTQWEGNESGLSLKLIEVKTESVLMAIKALSTTPAQDTQVQLVKEDLLPQLKTIQEQVQKIQQLQEAEKKKILAYINYRSENLGWILLSCLGISVLIGGTFATYIVIRVLKEIRMLKSKIMEISEGKLIDPIPPSRNELNSIIKALNILTENLRNIRHFAQEVGKGNFDTNIAVFNGQNDLGEALASMRESLKNVGLEEKQRTWVSSGQAHFAELLRASTENLTGYYQAIISELVKHLNINQAALYILEQPEGGEAVLEMKASYAYGRLKYHEKSLAPGQGMVGQVYLEKKPQFLNNLPKTFLQIGSGLGEASPTYLAVVPLMVNDTVNGVLELAAFHPLAPYQTEFLLKIAESISSALNNVSNVQTTGRLLEEAQAMAQAMQAQEEMLRQNSEELIATQEQLNRDLQETTQRAALLEKTLQHAPLPQLLLTPSGIITAANRKAEAFFGVSLQARHISELLDAPALADWLQQAEEQAAESLDYQHPQKGSLRLQLQSFSAEQQQFITLIVVPQEINSLA